MIQITSRNNNLICECAKLKDKKYRDKSALFVFEGKKLFFESIECGTEIEKIFVTDKGLSLIEGVKINAEIYHVTESVYEKLSDDFSPDGIFCVARQNRNTHQVVESIVDIFSTNEYNKLFMAVSVRDPGNLGTILRTASAMGIDAVLLSGDCVDIYNPKTVRSAMGALFKQKTVKFKDTDRIINELKSCGISVYAAALKENSRILGSFPLPYRHCFVAGNEGHGLDAQIIDLCSDTVIIPMMPNNESLNVATASSVLMWESCKENLLSRSVNN
jgi:TrmH family RNA methyltransferase